MTGLLETFAKLRRSGLLVPTLTTSLAFLVLMALGTWQWQRLSWKTALIAAIEARSAAAALPPEAWRNLKCRHQRDVGLELSCDYMAVRVRGTFDHAGERHVFIAIPKQPSGIGGPGYWVFTPLLLEHGAGRVFVNRGFVPEALKDATQRQDGQIAGVVEIAGLLRSSEQRATFSGENAPGKNVWYVRDPIEFAGGGTPSGPPAASAETVSGPSPRLFYVDQTGPLPPGGLPLPLAGKIALTNRHLEYALTWFALALTLLGVFGAYAHGILKKARHVHN